MVRKTRNIEFGQQGTPKSVANRLNKDRLAVAVIILVSYDPSGPLSRHAAGLTSKFREKPASSKCQTKLWCNI